MNSEEDLVSSTTDENIVYNLDEDSSETELVVMPSTSGYQSGKTDKKKEESKKLQLKEWKDKLNLMKPNECVKNIIVSIDEDLLVEDLFNDVTEIFVTNGISYKIVKSVYPLVTWTWEDLHLQRFKKIHTAVILNQVKFMFLAQNNMLMDYFFDLTEENPGQTFCLVLYGRVYREKEVKNEIDSLLCEIEVLTGMSCWKFEKSDEVASFFLNLTKSASQEPYRTEKQKHDQEKTFYLQGRSHNCVNIDKDNNGMKNLWIQQTSALHRLPLDSARILCATYPTPYCLYEEYNKLSSVKEKQELLQDILVGRDGVAKRLGPKMSKRIALLFGNDDGDLYSSSWS